MSTKLSIIPTRGRERGSILGTFELKKSLKINTFVSLCDNSAQKRAGKLKIYRILKNYMLSACGNRIKFVNFFQNREGQGNVCGPLCVKLGKNDLKSTINFKAPTNLP